MRKPRQTDKICRGYSFLTRTPDPTRLNFLITVGICEPFYCFAGASKPWINPFISAEQISPPTTLPRYTLTCLTKLVCLDGHHEIKEDLCHETLC